MIYFIADAYGHIKIGFSDHPPSRLHALRPANAQPLTLLATEFGGKGRERDLHTRFVHLRVRGEWFKAEKELLVHIAGLENSKLPSSWFTREDASIPTQAWLEAQQVLSEARREAESQRQEILAGAQEEALATVNTAKAKAGVMVTSASTAADSIVAGAQEKALAIVNIAKAEAAAVAASARKQARPIVVSAKASVQRRAIFDCRCVKCAQPSETVSRRDDGNPWCHPCWITRGESGYGELRRIASQAYKQGLGSPKMGREYLDRGHVEGGLGRANESMERQLSLRGF